MENLHTIYTEIALCYNMQGSTCNSGIFAKVEVSQIMNELFALVFDPWCLYFSKSEQWSLLRKNELVTLVSPFKKKIKNMKKLTHKLIRNCVLLQYESIRI